MMTAINIAPIASALKAKNGNFVGEINQVEATPDSASGAQSDDAEDTGDPDRTKRAPPADPLLAAALDYARRGIPIFPCMPNGKEPLVKWQDARTTNEAQIGAWWQAWPGANVGRVLADSGLCAIDIDLKGLDHLADLNLPDTAWMETPSGGYHLYYRGSLRPSIGKLAPGIDTRGEDSYVVCYGTINGRPYVYHDKPIAKLPAWVAERVNTTAQAKTDDRGIERDHPEMVERARAELQGKPMPGEDEPGDDYALAAAMLDHGLSVERAIALWRELWPDMDQDWAETQFEHVLKYRQNEGAPRAFDPHRYDEEIEASAQRASEARGRFQLETYEDGLSSPEMAFWDADRTLVNSEDGAVAVIYGASGDHKTNVTLTKCMELIRDRQARVVYATGEGGHGVRKQRMPAQVATHGVSVGVMRECWRRCPAVPLMANSDDVNAFCDAIEAEFGRPNIVVLDTWSNATAGVDENAKVMGDFLADNGPVGQIKRRFRCLVLVIAHSGKDGDRGIRGSSAQTGNADTVLHVTANKDTGGIRVHVDKQRDGPDGLDVYYKVEKIGVPVPVRISENEGKRLMAGGNGDEEAFLAAIVTHLTMQKAMSHKSGLDDRQLARLFMGDEPRDPDDLAAWQTRLNDTTASLREKHHKAANGKARTKAVWNLGSFAAPHGASHSEQNVWRWHLTPG